MNQEILILEKYFKKPDCFKIMVFSVFKPSTEAESDEWEGLIRSMKKHVSKQNERVVKQMKETKTEIVTQVNEEITKMSRSQEQMKV